MKQFGTLFEFPKTDYEPANNIHVFITYDHVLHFSSPDSISSSGSWSPSSLFNINITKVLNMVRSHNMEDVLAELQV